MKLIIIGMLVTLMALGTSCGQISQPVAEVAPQGTSDGIKVHGNWTVTVTNPDGTVDAVHEFENALAKGNGVGADILTHLLSGDIAVESWRIKLTGKGESWSGPFNSYTERFKCEDDLHSTSQTILEASMFKDIMAENGPLTLGAGCNVYDAEAEEAITQVGTIFKIGSGTLEVYVEQTNKIYSFTSGDTRTFTKHPVSIPVENGQIIAINVEISFE